MMFALLLLKITKPKLLTEQSCIMLVQVDDESKCLSNSKLKYVPLIISYMYKNLATRPFSSDVISLGQLNYSFNETAPRGLWPPSSFAEFHTKFCMSAWCQGSQYTKSKASTKQQTLPNQIEKSLVPLLLMHDVAKLIKMFGVCILRQVILIKRSKFVLVRPDHLKMNYL